MSDATKAVFLSYASQDAEAAKRICDALRAAGVEVWFDQSELVGGDAWDQKIRRQIKDCALLIPVISAATQARTEGYFRLEWRLADQRTHLMGRGRTFLLPVCIDGTKDAEADVPDSFSAVQWTRAAGGEVPPAFTARVKKLLDGSEMEAGRPRPAGRDEGTAAPVKGGPSKWWWVLPIFGVTMALLLVMKEGRKEPLSPAVPAVAAAKPPASLVATWPGDPELRRAMDLLNGTEANSEDFTLAEEIANRALAQRPTDPETVTVMARTQGAFLLRGFDRSDERVALARRYAERAVQLAPNDAEALAALGAVAARSDQARAVDLLNRAIALKPAEPFFHRIRDNALFSNPQVPPAEAVASAEKTAALFPNDALVHYELARHYRDLGRSADMEQELDRTIAITPIANAVVWKSRIALFVRGDPVEMKALLDRVPARVRSLERVVFSRWAYAMATGQWEEGRSALEDLTSNWIEDFDYIGPKALLAAQLLEQQGKPELARLKYEAALAELRTRQARTPGNATLRSLEVWIMHGLGRDEEARSLNRARMETVNRPYQFAQLSDWWFAAIPGCLLIGDRATALALMHEAVTPTGHAVRIRALAGGLGESGVAADTAAEARAALRMRFRFDPRMAPFRDDPEIAALLAEPVAMKSEDRGQRTEVSISIDEKSVAVLAFANLSDDKNNEYFSDGISEELLNVLAKVPGLKVTARTSSFFFKGKEVTVPEIARQLGVAYVVEGSVRKQGDKVRITAQLIKAADGFHVWSDTFTRDLKDIFAVQDEIAGLIAQNLSLKIGAGGHPRPEVNPEAHRLVLEARYFWNSRTLDGFDRAEAATRRALALDPDFAPAHAMLAIVLVTRSTYRGYEGIDDAAMPAARAAAERALALDPSLVEAQAALGIAAFIEGRSAEADAIFQRAIALNPSLALPHHWHSLVLESGGRLDEALREIDRAIELDPLSGIAIGTRGRYLASAGRYEQALAAFARAAPLLPDRPTLHGTPAHCLFQLGRKDEALAEARKVIALTVKELRLVADADAIYILRRTGHEAEAAGFADRILPQFVSDGYQRGVVLAMFGRWDEAEPYLARTPREMHYTFFWNPIWDPWRDDPRFVRLLAKLGCTAEYRVARETLSRMQGEAAGK